jgi:hypothetical protein
MGNRFGEPIARRDQVLGIEDRPDQRGEQAVLVLAGMPEAVPEEVDSAALPAAAQDLRDRGLQPGVRVGDGQLDADQAARDEAAQELGQNASVSASPTSIERISRRPVSWTPWAMTSALLTTRPPSRTFSTFASRNR